MKLVYQIIAFLTVTTVLYLIVKNSTGFGNAVKATAASISTVQKTAQGR